MTEARRLDPTQRAAAADAPVQLTLAGPGAGKTTTLAVRFVHLVRQGVDPRRILAVTFTRKAAIEMQDRIVRECPLRWPEYLSEGGKERLGTSLDTGTDHLAKILHATGEWMLP